MVDGVLGEWSLRVITFTLDSWAEHAALTSEISEFRHLVEAAARLTDTDERRCQVSPLLNPLQSLLHRVGSDPEQAHVVHLGLAAAYTAIGEEALQFHHLNRACDCAIRTMLKTWSRTKKKAFRRLRDEMIELLGARREVLIG